MRRDPYTAPLPFPAGWSDEHEVRLLGACCACQRDNVPLRNIVQLHVRGPMPGRGWGCLLCNLRPDGALAAVCDECLGLNRPIVNACADYVTKPARVPVVELTETFKHDLARHGG